MATNTDKSAWLARWDEGRIGFHEPKANPLLVRHFSALRLSAGQHIFLPLCGKTEDIPWLLAQGLRVSGAELSPIAIEALAGSLGGAEMTNLGPVTRYVIGNATLYCGDIFDLTAEALGKVDAVYDRAALVALPPELRGRYAQHVMNITASAPQLLVSFDYDQSQMSGPPHSVPEAEIQGHYGQTYNIEQLSSDPISGNLATRCSGTEEVRHLSPKAA